MATMCRSEQRVAARSIMLGGFLLGDEQRTNETGYDGRDGTTRRGRRPRTVWSVGGTRLDMEGVRRVADES
jgi:hypothetical protein